MALSVWLSQGTTAALLKNLGKAGYEAAWNTADSS